MKIKKVLFPMVMTTFILALIFISSNSMAAEGSSASASYRYVKQRAYAYMKKSAKSSSKTVTTVPYAHRVTYLGKSGSYSKVRFYSQMSKKTYTGYIKNSSLTTYKIDAYTSANAIYQSFMSWRGMKGKVYYAIGYCGKYMVYEGESTFPPVLMTSNYSKSSGRTIYMYVFDANERAVKRVTLNGKYTLTPSGKWLRILNHIAYKKSGKKYRVLYWDSLTKAKFVTMSKDDYFVKTLSFKKYK